MCIYKNRGVLNNDVKYVRFVNIMKYICLNIDMYFRAFQFDFSGILCRIPLAPNTFHDDEDGDTANLALSVHVLSVETPLAKNESIDESTARNWLVPMQGLNRMEGVPLETVPGRAIVNGDVFGFRLEGRDRAGQVVAHFFTLTSQIWHLT